MCWGRCCVRCRSYEQNKKNNGRASRGKTWKPKWPEWRSRLERSGLFPRLVGLLEQGVDPDAAETRDARFEFGLACVLDGVAGGSRA